MAVRLAPESLFGFARNGCSTSPESAWGQVKRLVAQADEGWAQHRIEGGLSSGEGLIWAVRDPIHKMERLPGGKNEEPRYVEVIADHGIEDKRLLVFEPEFGTTLRMLERQGNSLSGVIRQAWDVGRLSTLVKNVAAVATNAHVSIVGHVTRTELLRYLRRTEVAGGFANRHLFACTRRSKCLSRGGCLSSAVLTSLAARLERAIVAARTVEELAVSEDAWRVWDAVYPVLSEPRPGLLGAVISRSEAQTLRLAGLYALLDASPILQPAHLLAGLAVWEFCEQSARYIFTDALGDPIADEIMRALRAAGAAGLTRTQMRDLFGRNKAGDDIGRALGVLLEQRLARALADRDTGGRPAERWVATDPATTTELRRSRELTRVCFPKVDHRASHAHGAEHRHDCS